jgi:hypothetical protein
MYLKKIYLCIVIILLNWQNTFALTQDITLTILVPDALHSEYILAKSVCKLLGRELEVSHSYGGTNTLDCSVSFNNSVDDIITKIEQNQFQYAILKSSEFDTRPANLAIRSILYFPAEQDYVFVSNQNVDIDVIKEINFGVINHLLEFKYLHKSFINFSTENLIVKQKIPMHLGTLRFSDDWKNGKNLRITEVE